VGTLKFNGGHMVGTHNNIDKNINLYIFIVHFIDIFIL
jgi:hypothetical protein